jgi:hypothetical protein
MLSGANRLPSLRAVYVGTQNSKHQVTHLYALDIDSMCFQQSHSLEFTYRRIKSWLNFKPYAERSYIQQFDIVIGQMKASLDKLKKQQQK